MPAKTLSPDPLVGIELGHCRITETIGSGGMGVVYRARDEHLDREVAVKVLHPGIVADEPSRRHFRKEAQALSKLNHPNIATIHDFDTQRDVDFLVMEYIPGITLSEKLRAGPLPEKEIRRLGIQLAEGLAAAHEHGVIHRDVKPGNLRLAEDGRLKIMDFGLAKLVRQPADAATTESLAETRGIVGTLAYIAPEQLLGEEVDARTDIHAAGSVLYEMATGQRPFADVEGSQLVGAILRRPPLPPTVLNPKLSFELERIIEKCMEKEADSRYQSAKELAVDLRRVDHHTEPGSSKPEAHYGQPRGQVSSRRSMVPLMGAAILLLAVVAVLVVVAVGFWHKPVQKNARPVTTSSIAVLPFADLSPGHDQEYFSDGLAEEILNDLTKIPNVKVVARTSAFQFKGKNEDLGVIRQKLNVENVLEGSVRREGTHVRITAQLVKADDGFHLWSESYDRDLKDVLGVQDDIAKAVTSALQVKLLGGKTPAPLPRSQTTSPEAYQDFLQARYFADRADRESRQRALDYINRAIEADPHYAPAYALRASITVSFGSIGWTDYSEAIQKGRRDIGKAMELDPNLADGYRVLSRIQAFGESNCRAAEITLKRALELAPGNAENLSWAAFIANCLSRQEEAVTLLNQALALDPLVPKLYRQLAQYLRDLGRYEEAHVLLGKALDLNPSETWTHETRGEVYLAQGRPREALAEMEKEPSGGCLHDFGMALAYHAVGQPEESEAALASLVSQNPNGCAYQIAEVYAYRREMEQAFAWLTRAYMQHDAGLCLIKTDLLLKSLRSDPRYARMLGTLNLAD